MKPTLLKSNSEKLPLRFAKILKPEAKFIAVTKSGVITEWSTNINNHHIKFKLIVSNGDEYFIQADKKWNLIFDKLVWQQTKIHALLNTSNNILIPQKVSLYRPKEKLRGSEKNYKHIHKTNRFVKILPDSLQTIGIANF